MFVATVVVSVLLAAALTLSGILKITRNPRVVPGYAAIGVPDNWLTPLGAVLIAGAVGLVAGLWLAPVGIAAAIGLILYFLGGIGFHARAKDWKGLVAPVLILLVAVVALDLRLVTT
ncbi:DoxX family protein [Nocardia sp. NPDC052566]|uniref:DoxX family protein n=1 Tax=Nocardia sp. NPDC052566 TaxID=3364330 RepID=UPI0037CBB1D3